MKAIEKIITAVKVDSCMEETESAMIELHKEIKHAVRLRVEDKISDDDYITMTAKACAEFVKFMARDTCANCGAIAKTKEMHFN